MGNIVAHSTVFCVRPKPIPQGGKQGSGPVTNGAGADNVARLVILWALEVNISAGSDWANGEGGNEGGMDIRFCEGLGGKC